MKRHTSKHHPKNAFYENNLIIWMFYRIARGVRYVYEKYHKSNINNKGLHKKTTYNKSQH